MAHRGSLPPGHHALLSGQRPPAYLEMGGRAPNPNPMEAGGGRAPNPNPNPNMETGGGRAASLTVETAEAAVEAAQAAVEAADAAEARFTETLTLTQP